MASAAPTPIAVAWRPGPFACALAALALGLAAPAFALLTCAAAAVAAHADGAEHPPHWRKFAGPALGAAIVLATIGPAGAVGFLFAWRLWADARWSAREAQRLRALEPHQKPGGAGAFAHWLTPAFVLATTAASAPHILMGLPLDLPHAPWVVPAAIGACAFIALFDWALRMLADWRLGLFARRACAHMFAHHAMFLTAYWLCPDISAGFAAMIVWRLMHARATPQASFTAVP